MIFWSLQKIEGPDLNLYHPTHLFPHALSRFLLSNLPILAKKREMLAHSRDRWWCNDKTIFSWWKFYSQFSRCSLCFHKVFSSSNIWLFQAIRQLQSGNVRKMVLYVMDTQALQKKDITRKIRQVRYMFHSTLNILVCFPSHFSILLLNAHILWKEFPKNTFLSQVSLRL